jgi:hypothetical protein
MRGETAPQVIDPHERAPSSCQPLYSYVVTSLTVGLGGPEVGSKDALGGQAQGEVAHGGGQVSRTVAAMGLLLHPRDACLAPLNVAGQRLVDGLVSRERLGQHERVLERHRRALRHVR